MSETPTNGARFKGFGQLGNFKSMGFGTRVAGMLPRVKSNSMLLARFLPDSANVMSNVEAKTTGTVFMVHCLSIGAPRKGLSMPSAGGLPSGGGFSFGGLTSGRAAAVNVNSVWGLYNTDNVPQMFVSLTERTATVGTTSVKFVDAEFAKAKPDPMTLSIFAGDAAKQVATTFPSESGYAKFTWQLA